MKRYLTAPRLLFAAASLLIAATASAQAYPARPIRMIVPFPVGGSTDTYARLAGKLLGEALGQPVIVDNRAGATGLIGSRLVKDAPADGYTLLYTTNSAHVIGPLLHKQHAFDPVADFTPITEALRFPAYVVASTKLPARTFKEFIALAKARQGALSYASAGTGGGSHLACEQMLDAAGIKALHVPYSGAGPAQTSVMSGEVDFLCDSVGNSQPMVRAGKMRGLALAAAQRSPAIPDIPTLREEGVPVEAYVWQGVFAPKGLPADIRDKLATEIARVMRMPDMQARLRKDGYDPVLQPPEQFAKDLVAEQAMWARLIAQKNIKAD
ncbi:tripartite tricarboxylate transporter substrate binding protein [Pigmentiphaga sp. YJ18]|uniref:Bug family tripartite tricarboxylate transporter substrate binding protein n=1 Tax=Pigmentiphaga sp. YJ18 TaxID=3134907 RepID=UPI003110E027